jgi:hypothetical protein
VAGYGDQFHLFRHGCGFRDLVLESAEARIYDGHCDHCAVTLGSAIVMWYISLPGASKRQTTTPECTPAHARCCPRGDHPRPNLLHVCFHVLFDNFCCTGCVPSYDRKYYSETALTVASDPSPRVG